MTAGPYRTEAEARQNGPGMGELRGFSAVTDNVLRRQEYERRHPSVTIRHHEQPPPWHWAATWTEAGSNCRLTDDSLGGLLDALDNLDLGTAS